MINILELLKRKVTLFILFVCLVLLTGCSFKAENNSSNEIIQFKDSNLKDALLKNGLDLDESGEIVFKEADSYEGILDLSGSDIESIDGIEHFANANIINLSNNKIKNIEPISKMESLTSLDLSFNNIEDVTGLASCTNLVVLDLSSNNIAFIAPVSNLNRLKFLDISNNNVTNVNEVGRCSSLSYLLMEGNNVSDMNSLKYLRIIELWINDTSISSIPEEILRVLRKVNISNTDVDENEIMSFTEIIK